jgi:phosphate starvation-inducible protein PhoH and related proteins
LQEKEIKIPVADPVELFGSDNKRLKIIQKHFSKLKIVARGDLIKIHGEPAEIERFSAKMDQLFSHLDRYNSLSERELEDILDANGSQEERVAKDDRIIVHGAGGIKVRARTKNQQRMVAAVDDDDMVFAIGPAGTGKTYTAVALAVRALKEKKVKRIILTRPAVEAGENLGFLPGDLKEKLDPYMQPLYDALIDMIHFEKLAEYIDRGVIEIAPLAFMRGRTLDKAFVILDEAQNATIPQMKMFLTRMGEQAKFVITGDATQVDLPRKQPSGLVKAEQLLSGVEGISIIRLDESDVIRHKLVGKIIKAFANSDE